MSHCGHSFVSFWGGRTFVTDRVSIAQLLDCLLWRTRAYRTAPHAWWDLQSCAEEVWQ